MAMDSGQLLHRWRETGDSRILVLQNNAVNSIDEVRKQRRNLKENGNKNKNLYTESEKRQLWFIEHIIREKG